MTGSGTENDPYIIYDVDNLQAINDHIADTVRYSRPWDDSFGEAEQVMFSRSSPFTPYVTFVEVEGTDIVGVKAASIEVVR